MSELRRTATIGAGGRFTTLEDAVTFYASIGMRLVAYENDCAEFAAGVIETQAITRDGRAWGELDWSHIRLQPARVKREQPERPPKQRRQRLTPKPATQSRPTTCVIEGCDQPVAAGSRSGLCSAHREQAARQASNARRKVKRAAARAMAAALPKPAPAPTARRRATVCKVCGDVRYPAAKNALCKAHWEAYRREQKRLSRERRSAPGDKHVCRICGEPRDPNATVALCHEHHREQARAYDERHRQKERDWREVHLYPLMDALLELPDGDTLIVYEHYAVTYANDHYILVEYSVAESEWRIDDVRMGRRMTARALALCILAHATRKDDAA